MFGRQRSDLKLQPCPRLRDSGKCRVLGCIYKHEQSKNSGSTSQSALDSSTSTASSPREALSPKPLVRRTPKMGARPVTKMHSSPIGTPNTFGNSKLLSTVTAAGVRKPVHTRFSATVSQIRKQTSPVSAPSREPSSKGTQPTTPRAKTKHKITAELIPRSLANEPTGFAYRCTMLTSLADKLEQYGGCDDVVSTAVEIEAKVAEAATTATYAQEIRNAVRAVMRGEYTSGYAARAAAAKAQLELAQLRKGLEERVLGADKLKHYVLSVPQSQHPFDFDLKRPCDRCQQETSAAEIGETWAALKSGRMAPEPICRYHMQRRQWDPETRKLQLTFPCCGENTTDTPGCSTHSSHVFKLQSPEELHSMIPYVTAPEPDPDRPVEFAVALDCEMAYTSRGMEMIRLSAISWDTGKAIFDRLVYPQGQVIDLNTRWSGVADLETGTTLEGKHYPPLTFQECMTEFFKLVDRNTIIVGHGLENDLNTMRLAHNRIADTVRTYPQHSTRLHKLKDLSWRYLSRHIQSGEHDSFEDALAAMDIIKADVLGRLPRFDQPAISAPSETLVAAKQQREAESAVGVCVSNLNAETTGKPSQA